MSCEISYLFFCNNLTSDKSPGVVTMTLHKKWQKVGIEDSVTIVGSFGLSCYLILYTMCQSALLLVLQQQKLIEYSKYLKTFVSQTSKLFYKKLIYIIFLSTYVLLIVAIDSLRTLETQPNCQLTRANNIQPIVVNPLDQFYLFFKRCYLSGAVCKPVYSSDLFTS